MGRCEIVLCGKCLDELPRLVIVTAHLGVEQIDALGRIGEGVRELLGRGFDILAGRRRIVLCGGDQIAELINTDPAGTKERHLDIARRSD